MNDDERRQIISEAYATLERTRNVGEDNAFVRKLSDPLAQWRAEANAQMAREARWNEQRREREAAAAREATQAIDIESAEAWLRARLDLERRRVVETLGQEIAELLDAESAAAKDELDASVRSLRTEIIELGETIGEVRRTIASGKRGGEIIDLPARRSN